MYLRHAILCDADLTLEPFDPLERDFAKNRLGAVHVCHDWTKLWDAFQDDWDAWQTYMSSSDMVG